MVDSSKRRSLKSLGGIMAMPLVPATLMPITGQANSTKVGSATGVVKNVINNEELSISLLLGEQPVMRVTNNSSKLTILRRIHPGVVHAGATTYDLNTALNNSFYAIGAGSTRTIPIAEAGGVQATHMMPRVGKRRPMRLASITSDNDSGRILDASRAFFV